MCVCVCCVSVLGGGVGRGTLTAVQVGNPSEGYDDVAFDTTCPPRDAWIGWREWSRCEYVVQ